MDRREHHRAQLCMPVRIRWNTPFGQKIEFCKTVDISRGGLLVPCQETHASGVPLWVTFPYDASLGDGQPEMLAKVVRAANTQNGNGHKSAEEDSTGRALALHFASSVRVESNGNGHAYLKGPERRENPRWALAIPVRVRPEHVPWFEEAMTMDISARGLRFLSSREYEVEQRLLIALPPMVVVPWPSAETPARVLRTEALPESAALVVTIAREV